MEDKTEMGTTVRSGSLGIRNLLAITHCLLVLIVVGCADGVRDTSKISAADKDKQADDGPEQAVPANVSFTSNRDDSVTEAMGGSTGFRGDSAFGTAKSAHLPVAWDHEKFVHWKCKLNGAGASSPISTRGRVFTTTFTGYGEAEDRPGEKSKLAHHLVCLDAENGQPIWSRRINGANVPKLTPNNSTHGFASSTPVTDGNMVYAFFGTSGVFAFDLEGNLKWQQNVGCGTDNFGSAASLAICDNLLIINASIENGNLYALDKQSGLAVWRFGGMVRSWSTPIVAMNAAGEQELLVSNSKTLFSLIPSSGKVRWQCDSIDDYVVSTPIVHEGICYLTGGKQKQTLAIRMGGQGDVTDTHVIWRKKFGANVISPVYHDGLLFISADNGIMQVIDAEKGKLVKQVRIPGVRKVFASPTVIGDHLFLPTVNKGVAVLTTDIECQVMRANVVDDLPLKASLAVDQDRVYLRNSEFVYCISTEEESPHPRMCEVINQGPAQAIQPSVSPDFDKQIGSQKKYLDLLVNRPEDLLTTAVRPYASVITTQQTNDSAEIVRQRHREFLDLKEDREEAHWKLLAGTISVDSYLSIVKGIEAQANDKIRQVRIQIKKLFSAEQMQQHLAEAAERKKKRRR